MRKPTVRKKEETSTQNLIRMALSETCVCFRINVGLFATEDGRKITTGVPAGFSDLFGHRKSDGKAFYIECKTATGRTRSKQIKFLKNIRATGALAGVARSVEDALKIVEEK